MPVFVKYLIESGVLLAAGRGAWMAFTWYVAYRDRKNTEKEFNGRGEIKKALDRLIDETPANYAHVIHVHNGGGDLKAGMPMFMSCLFEAHRPSVRPQRLAIQGIEIDEHYRLMLEMLIELKDATAEVKQVDDQLLQDVFQVMNAKFARSIILRINKKGIFFLRTTSATDPLDLPEDALLFRQTVSLLKKHY